MKKFIVFLAFVIAGLMWFHKELQNGEFLYFLDTHPNQFIVPAVEQWMGDGYYLFHNLSEAATYYYRVPQYYPNTLEADDCYWGYIQTLEDNSATSRPALIDAYSAYLAQFTHGAHIVEAKNKLDAYKSDVR